MSQSNSSFKNFVNNHKFTFVASIASILGLALGLVTLFPPQKKPFYSIKSFNLINDSSSTIENLDIKYKICNDNRQKEECKLEAIKSLTVTQILFWNGGRTKIDKTDVDDNPLAIVASDDNKILEIKVVHISNDKTNFRVERKTNIVDFNFLDSGNGGVVKIIHTGLSNKDITLNGYVEESKFDGDIKLIKIDENTLILGNAGIIIYLTAIIPALGMAYYLYKIVVRKSKNLYALLLFILLLVFCIPLVYTLGFTLFHRLNLRYPLNSYKVFNSEITPE